MNLFTLITLSFCVFFERQSIKGGRCSTLNQYYISTISDEVINIFSKELDINDYICEVSDKEFEFRNKYRKIPKHENYLQFEDYRDINQAEIEKCVNDKLSKLPKHEKLRKLNLYDVMLAFDATSLYPSALWVEKSVYPKIETGFAYKL